MDADLKLPKPPQGFYWKITRPGIFDPEKSIFELKKLVTIPLLGLTFGKTYARSYLTKNDSNQYVQDIAQSLLDTLTAELPAEVYGTYYKEDQS